MEKQVKEFLEKIVNNYYDTYDGVKMGASKLLCAEFKKQVRELWQWEIVKGVGASKEKRKYIKELTPARFILEYKYESDKLEFIEKNWDKLDLIILTIHEYIDEVDAIEKEEE